MSNPLANFQAITLNKPMTVNVPYFPEAGIVAQEGEKIVVQIPEGTTVYISIKGPKASYVPVPVPTLQQPAPVQPAGQYLPPAAHQKSTKTYKPKAQSGNNNSAATNAAPATTNNASAANGVANGGNGSQHGSSRGRGGSQRSHENRNPGSQRNNSANNAAVPAGLKVVTAEELKRQREEQSKHEAWLQQRKELQRKEREEQDRRYKERVARQQQAKQKAKEEAEAKRKQQLLEGGHIAEGDVLPEGEKGEKEKGDGKKTCWVCNSELHISRKCPLKCKRSACNTNPTTIHAMRDCAEHCALCTGKGHDEWFCDNRCKMCNRVSGVEAHLPQNCPIECGLCGGKGHRTRECTYNYHNRKTTAN